MQKPSFVDTPGARAVVVLIHGFMGSPRQLDFLAEAARGRGMATSSLLLPGHDCVKTFASATAQGWLDHVYAELEARAGQYERIFLAGHSMGSLLALHGAARYPDAVSGLLALCCPLRLRPFSLDALKVRAAQLFYPAAHPMKAAYLAGSSLPPGPGLLWHSRRPARELEALIAATPAILPRVLAPVTALFARRDELVSADGLEILAAGLPRGALTARILPDSLHAYYPEADRAAVIAAFLDMLER